MSRQASSDVIFMSQNHNDGKGPDAQQQPEERKRWDRVFPMLLVMFGSPWDDQENMHTGDRDVFEATGSKSQEVYVSARWY
jgi:hypothetical protein